MKRIYISLITLLLLSISIPVSAQYADEEYRMEMGIMAGGSSYLGDANYSSILRNMGFTTGVIARYNLNPRMVIKGDILMGQISGDTEIDENRFPEGIQSTFERTIYDFGIQFEYNFWPYGNGMSYKQSYRFTPYLMGGLGVTYASKPAENVATTNFVLGGGVKYKFAPRWNIGCEFSMRFTNTDKLDVTSKTEEGLNDPYGIKGSSFKNKDCYSVIALMVSYDLFPKCDNCNKD